MADDATGRMPAALREALADRGALFGEAAGAEVARRFGDGAAEYRAVREAAGVADRGDRAVVRLHGRDPVRMVQGLVTNDLAGAPPERAVYAALPNPKGRAVAELRALRREEADGAEVLLDLPREALAGTTDHLRRYVPPMFARWEDASEAIRVLGVYGPRAPGVLSAVLGDVPALEEDAVAEASFGGARVTLVGTREAGGEPGADLLVPAEAAAGLWAALAEAAEDAGGGPVGFGALETLRVEAGRPRWGRDFDEGNIVTEAFEGPGLMERGVSFSKGCYTGQEVIVRIAHRGHVNRTVRGLLLGDAPVPAPRTPLLHPETGREVGWTGSAALSPLAGQTVALAMLRRELAPGERVRVGAEDGPEATVSDLPFEPAGA